MPSYTLSTSSIHPASCYFSYAPRSSDHWSSETPIDTPVSSSQPTADTRNPFLAARLPPAYLTPTSMDVSKFLQLQTAAAYQNNHQSRPQMSSSSSNSSSGSGSSSPSRPVMQCSRCQHEGGAMVKYSLSSYYCNRCAQIVGYPG
ncbi:hypothetical protein EJ08DRAFT_702448 [Tothia fuscella]|uniref:Uncharacterized protein n=1 Tax=Tothia fuscella TaxID=1048955 RepID=A0A9P4TTH7_9PEZI|nr:hypothetical protein EJ08DRAFT_702448 [Tothia fuscella]